MLDPPQELIGPLPAPARSTSRWRHDVDGGASSWLRRRGSGGIRSSLGSVRCSMQVHSCGSGEGRSGSSLLRSPHQAFFH
uniref:Uncharacterized protein n=1 Tax=Setaria italica TaxID=4555 RepID=K3ZKP7_SETIT